jgi:hypothetical protein
MDISTAAMLLVQKVTSLSWNISDYKFLDEEKKSVQSSSEGAKVGLVLSAHLKRSALKEIPSFFRYSAYVLFPINLNVG